MLTQLNPSIPLNTPKGTAECWAIIDYGPEHDLLWVCCIDTTGEIWTVSNKEVRGCKNVSLGRKLATPDPVKEFLSAIAEMTTPVIVSKREELQEEAKRLLEKMK